METIDYILNGTNFRNYGVYVSASTGLIDGLKPKAPIVLDWPDMHGHVVDLEKRVYETRDIVLSCFIIADDNSALEAKVNDFLSLFAGPGLKQLVVDINYPSGKPLVYMVYLSDSVSVQKKWKSGAQVATFVLRLKEPEPVKRVLKFTLVAGQNGTAITLATKSPLNFYWGDGNITTDVFKIDGTQFTIYHDYYDDTAPFADGSIFYVVITGNIEEIIYFNHGPYFETIWNKLS